jgi:DNA-binding MarR family transcriptional regulator
VGPAARTIIELNIRHYRGLLKTEKDPSTRQTIVKLLAEEEAKLAQLSERERKAD